MVPFSGTGSGIREKGERMLKKYFTDVCFLTVVTICPSAFAFVPIASLVRETIYQNITTIDMEVKTILIY